MSYEQNYNEYPQSWYPICLSSEIKRGHVKLLTAFDQTYVVYRGYTGKVGVLERYCCHMGADLSKGQVVDDTLRCPLHHWQFNTSGICQNIPASIDIPKNAKITAFVVQENLGIIFIFLGKTALFDLPNSFFKQDLCFSSPWIIPVTAPYFYVAANGFDTQHLFSVHNRKIIGDPDIVVRDAYNLSVTVSSEVLRSTWLDKLVWLLGVKRLDVHISCWGSSIIIVHNQASHYYFMMSLLPVSRNNSKVFIVALAEHNNTFLSKLITAIKLPIQRIIGDKFIRADLPIISSMKLKLGTLLPNQDDGIVHYFRYLDKLPKFKI